MGWGSRGCAVLFGLIAFACGEREPVPDLHGAGRAPRVVSLHDVTTELLVELGAGARLVGVSDPVDLLPAVSAAVAGMRRVAGLESILAVQPDLVLGLGVVAEREPELVMRLRQAGVDVHLVDPVALADVYELTRWVAARVGADARGEELLARLRDAGQQAASRRGEALRIFVYDCCDPPFTAGGKTVLSDLIARAGGRNVFGELAADWTHVSWEEVVQRRPELIVVHAYRYEGQGDVEDKQRALQAIPALSGVPTEVLPLGCSLGGLRSAEGLLRLRAAIAGHS